MSRLFEQFRDSAEPPIGLFFGMFVNNLAYLGSLLVLVVLLAGKGTLDENRYGTMPT